MSNDVVGFLFIAGIVGFICGIVAGLIASHKDRSQGGFFLLGFFFGPIGILTAVLVAPGRPAAPRGTRAIACPRCNAQHVASTQPDYECWQCKLVSPAA